MQGVGYRYFTQDAAERLHLAGYVRNLLDGRVEVYAIGSAEQIAAFRIALEQGPRFAGVERVTDEMVAVDPQFAREFVIANTASG